ncbi:MAG: DUF3108 domain-containing protein [Wenzhouxiangella sp.]|nr:DUF3108 domain-containing protein [Wenzhouxiangella sp.]
MFRLSILLLTLVLSAMPTAMADDHDRALPTLDAALIATGQFDYTTTLVIGDTKLEIESRRHIGRDLDEQGETILLVETVTRSGMGDTTERLELDAISLLPKKQRVAQGDSTMSADYSESQVTGLIRAAGQVVPIDLKLDAPAYGGEAALEAVLTALPLASGYRTRLRAMEIDVEQLVRRFAVIVEERETIEVPAGEFDTWRLRLAALDGLGGSQVLWIGVEAPRVLVRAQGFIPEEVGQGSLITELTSWDR